MAELWRDDFIAYDTETTGFDSGARIIELAIVRFSGGEIKEIFSSTFDPPDVDWGSPSVQDASAINGLTKEKLAGCPTFGSHAGIILEYFQKCGVWVAHNAKFDQRMLQQEFRKWGREFQPTNQHWSLCTLSIARQLNSNFGGNKLAEACARYGVELIDAHTAEADTIAAGQLFIKQLQSGKLPNNWTDIACPSRSKWAQRCGH